MHDFFFERWSSILIRDIHHLSILPEQFILGKTKLIFWSTGKMELIFRVGIFQKIVFWIANTEEKPEIYNLL